MFCRVVFQLLMFGEVMISPVHMIEDIKVNGVKYLKPAQEETLRG